MSLRNRIYKKMHREIRKQKASVVTQIARELLQQPFWARVKLAWRIIIKGK